MQHYVVHSCLLTVLLAARNNNNINMITDDTVIKALHHGPVVSIDTLLTVFWVVDCVLFDILLDNEGHPLHIAVGGGGGAELMGLVLCCATDLTRLPHSEKKVVEKD